MPEVHPISEYYNGLILPAYTAQHLYSLHPDFFKKISLYRPGTQRVLIGRPVADLQRDESRFICRFGHRERHMRPRKQNAHKRHFQTYPRAEFRVSYYTYAVCALSYSTGDITVLQEYHSKKEAKSQIHA